MCVCVCGVCARVLFFGRWVLLLGGCVLVFGWVLDRWVVFVF